VPNRPVKRLLSDFEAGACGCRAAPFAVDRTRAPLKPITSRRGPYREVTWSAIFLGIDIGIMLSGCFTYTGLLIGFTIRGSAVAAILGYGALRGILRKGTIVENNINQTIASGINITTAGVIFTVPAFYLMGERFNSWLVALAAIAGALIGILFIIPIRKQMIDLDRLRFPTGTAVATLLRSPGAGVAKSRLLLLGAAISAVVYFFSQFPVSFGEGQFLFGWEGTILPAEVDLGAILHLPSFIDNVWALSLFSLGAGFITGRPGLVVLAGGSWPTGWSRQSRSSTIGCQPICCRLMQQASALPRRPAPDRR
jgi:uncharacterized oligopeptide transporter (OPT) family protein